MSTPGRYTTREMRQFRDMIYEARGLQDEKDLEYGVRLLQRPRETRRLTRHLIHTGSRGYLEKYM